MPDPQNNSATPSHLQSVFQFICSIRFTIALLVALAVILAVATFIESSEGTGAVQMKVYRATWFNVFLAGFTINMLGGTYKRFRPLWVYFGFAVTHVGVFIILLGAFLTRNFGIEGQMTIPEAATRGHFIGNDDKLSVTVGGGENVSLYVPIDRGSKKRDLWISGKLPASGISVVLDQYWPDLQFEPGVEPGGTEENPAVQFKLSAMGSDAAGWLAPRIPGRQSADLGPMHVRIAEIQGDPPAEKPADVSKPNLLVLSDATGKHKVEVPAIAGKTSEVKLGDKSLKVTIRQAFDNFTMDGKDFHDRPGAPENPAVAFLVETAEGKSPDISFANYPDFSLQHSKKDPGYRARYLFRQASQAAGTGLTVYICDGSRLAYSSRMGSKTAVSGKLEPGKAIDLMDGRLTFTILRFEKKARLANKAVNASDEARNPAVHVKLVPSSGEGAGVWLPWGETREVELAGKKLSLIYQGDKYEMPFSLKLVKFKEDKYPGSNQSASYESRVFLTDAQNGRSEEILISMNEPLLYRGYTFFQSSFIPGETYTTVLSVSRDPGKWPTYIGYILMTAGMILMFYLKPFMARWDQARLKKEKGQ